MGSISHRQLQHESAAALRAVAAGESVQVTSNGVVIAVITPPSGDPLDLLIARGHARAPRAAQSTLAGITRTCMDRSSADVIADARGCW